MTLHPPIKFLACALAVVTLVGCASFKPEALRANDVADQAKTLKDQRSKEIEPLSGVLTLEEAIARAIKYNADRQVRLMEEAMAYGALDMANFDSLPKWVASAGYRSRDSDLLTNLRAGPNSPITPGSTISSSRNATTSDLSLTWSLLDFGQSYYAAKQSGDRVMIAGERRRKALHNLVQDVRTAYWRVVAAEKLGQTLRETMAEAQAALSASQAAQSSALRSPLEPLRFQRQLLENLRMLESIEQELSFARVELSTLAALPAASTFTVQEPQQPVTTRWLDVNPSDMELQAIVNNPDMRESVYNARIARDEARRTILKMFPGLSFSYGAKQTDDPYIVNQQWNEVGAQISFNLLGVLNAPVQRRMAELGISVAEQRRAAKKKRKNNMSFLGGGGGGSGTTVTSVTPYAPAQPALNQILSNASQLYQQGATSPYVAPSEQTLTGLGIQESLGTSAAQQLANTLAGNYLNPFLSPIIQQAGQEAYGTVSQQFSGAGRTPGSPMSQQQVADIVAQKALPYAFQSYGQERQNQLGVAQAVPSLFTTGQQLEQLQRQYQQAPFQALQQYAGLVTPIASGLPTQTRDTQSQSNPLTLGLGGALVGSQVLPSIFSGLTPGMGAAYGGLGAAGLGLLGLL